MNLRFSKKAAEKLNADAEDAERVKKEGEARREQEKKERDDKRDAERAIARAREGAKRERARLSDESLAKAIGVLEEAQAFASTSHKRREHTELCISARRSEIRRLQVDLETAQADLKDLEARHAKMATDDVPDAQLVAETAWFEHGQAWAALSQGYRKKHRDRAVRKRARDAGLSDDKARA